MAEPLRYPLKAFTDKTDYLQIGVVNYTAIGKNENYVSERGTRRNTRNIKELEEIILLPIPSNIQDNNSTIKLSSSESMPVIPNLFCIISNQAFLYFSGNTELFTII